VSDRRPGLREVLGVSAIMLAVVAVAVVVTAVLPAGGQYIVLRTPLLIVVLVAGTAGVLWRITRPGRPEQ
jgi:FtsH-binding integral membrane protein